MRLLIAAVAALLLLLPLPACEEIFDGRVCTLIGCDDGLRVELEPAPAGAFTIEVVMAGGERHEVQCDSSSACPGGAFFRGVVASEVTIVVTSSAGVREQTVRPQYVRTQPNGRGCPPICDQATVRVAAAM